MKDRNQKRRTGEADQASTLSPQYVESTSADSPASTDAAGAGVMSIDVNRRLRRIEQLLELLPLLLAQVTDPTHLSIESAARALSVSTKTIRRRISAGSLHLETITGTRRSGIAVDELFNQWVDLRTSRRALARERAMKMEKN